MELSAISSALSIISSRFLDSAYRAGASIVGLALVVSWFSDEHDGPDEALLNALTALGIPTGWLNETVLWMTEREEIFVWVGGVLLFFAVLDLALTSSSSSVLSQRSTSTIWLWWAALAAVGQGGAVVGLLVSGALLSLFKDVVKDKDGEMFAVRFIALVGALAFGPALAIMMSIDSPQREGSKRSDAS